MTSDLQTRAKEVVMPTSQLLDLLCIMFPQQTRKNLNSRLDRYHDYEKVVNIKGMTITYAGQPGGNGTQHYWSVSVINAEADLQEIFQKYQSKLGSIVLRGSRPNNQGQNANLEWHGLFFRSLAELKIAEALDDNHILFFPNSRGRVSDRYQQKSTIEVDFLIIHQGKVGILEVDGATYHPSAAKDHQRDRLFMRRGVICSRFEAGECMDHPQSVVEEFLELLVNSLL